MNASAPRMVPAFHHEPGNHCGSTALRNLLAFHGLEISEEMAFGLGAGACFFYVVLEDASPSRWLNGRALRLEENFVELTGAPLALSTFAESESSMLAARDKVDAGRPVILLTDLYYLDHYGSSAHFPGHAVVLAGYDDQFAYLSDTGFAELKRTRLENLARARHAEHPALPLHGQMFHLEGEAALEGLLAAAPQAIERASREMLEPDLAPFAGMPALRAFAAEAGSWPDLAEDWSWCARFAYQVIERRGTGGGNFRLMYGRFLAEAGFHREAELSTAAALRWSELAESFRTASERDGPDPGAWRRIGELARGTCEAEERLWTALSRASAQAAKRAK